MRTLDRIFLYIFFFLAVLMTGNAYLTVSTINEQKEIQKKINDLNTQLSPLKNDLESLSEEGKKITSIVKEMTYKPPEPKKEEKGRWTDEENWKRVTDGMSIVQVIELLGNPTSQEMDKNNVVSYYYEGFTSSGEISGQILFMNNKVFIIQPPRFKK